MSPVHALLVLVASLGGEPAGEVLDFSASYCGPCRQMKPLVSQLEREGLPIRQVDIQAERALAERFHVEKIPTFILVIDGREVARRVGMMSESDLRRMCARIPDEPAEPEVLLADSSPQSRAAVAQPVDLRREEEKPKTNPFLDLFRGKRSRNQQLARGNDDAPDSTPGTETRITTDDPMAASVRIRATINGQISLGSGTVVHSQPGRTLIVTCGHIFRDHNDDTKVEVDLFEGGKAQTYVATIVDTDLEADVGLISIPTHSAVSSLPLAPPTLQLATGDPVACIGCSAGKDPTLEPMQITAVNKYDGPDNIECTKTPVQGRSGGGLFNADHQLIGVCIAAVMDAKLGVYAHAFAVHSLLNRNGLSNLYQPEPEPLPDAVLAEAAASQTPPDFPSEPEVLPAVARTGNDSTHEQAVAANSPSDSATSSDLASVMADVAAGDAEVVVIIRSRTNPDVQSRVVIINRASPKFLAYLNGEIRPEGLVRNRPAAPPHSPSLLRKRDEQELASDTPPRNPPQRQPVSYQPPRRISLPRQPRQTSANSTTDARRNTMTAAR